jgi:DNA-binding GntR family transcriptional regulator
MTAIADLASPSADAAGVTDPSSDPAGAAPRAIAFLASVAEGATLPASVAQHLRALITEGALAPGTRLNERALGERLGVSRTPLREALRLLAADGLVRLQPNRGAQVVMLSQSDVRESFEVMSGLEAQSGELACRNVCVEDIAEIKALTFEMLACHARRDLPTYYRINHAIHERINRAAGNRLLTEVYDRINRRIQNLRFRSNFDQEKWNRAAHDHAMMVDALEARDGARLAAILRAHLVQKGETVLESMRSAAGNVPAD